MNTRRSYLVLVSLIVLALVGVGLIALPQSPFYKKPVLGLDLQGGLEVILKADPPPGRKITENDLKRSETIIRNRIDKLGVSEPIVARQGEDQISVQLAGVTDVNRARDLIGKTAQLEFYDLEGDLVPPSISRGFPIPNERLYDLLAGQQSSIQEGGGKEWRVFDVKSKKVVAGPFPTKAVAENSEKFKEGGKDVRVMGVPKNRIVITCSSKSAVICPPGASTPVPGVIYYYLFKYQPENSEHPIPEMKGKDLKLSGTRSDFDQNGQPIVLMQFTKDGTDKFGDITRELAQRGKRVSFGGQDQF